SKARRAGVKLPPPKRGKGRTKRQAKRDLAKGRAVRRKKPSRRRSRATKRALKRESRRSASKRALSRHAKRVARQRSARSRAVAIAFAKEGADISVIYLEERKDANETKRLVEENGSKCLLIEGDVGQEEFCRKAVNQTMKDFGRLDVVVNNAAEQHPQDSIE